MNARARAGLIAVASTLGFGACVSLDRPAAAKRRFVLSAARNESKAPAPSGHLLVLPFRVQAPFAGPGFVTLRAAGEVESDFLHEFFAPPGALLSDLCRRWLTDAGTFATVTGEGSRVAPTTILEADVTELALDLRTAGAPHATLTLEVVVLDAARNVRRSCRLGQRAALPDARPESLVAGFNACIAEAYAALETHLR